jgi:hypothetical protein
LKVHELLMVKQRDLPGDAPIPADRTTPIVAPVQAPNRMAGRRERLGSHDILPDADPNDGVTGDVPVALDPPPISLAPISTPHTRDLDFIKAQIARLPRPTEQ